MFGCSPGKGIIDAIFIKQQIQNKPLAKMKWLFDDHLEKPLIGYREKWLKELSESLSLRSGWLEH